MGADNVLAVVLAFACGMAFGAALVLWVDLYERHKSRAYERARIRADAERARDTYLLMIEEESRIHG